MQKIKFDEFDGEMKKTSFATSYKYGVHPIVKIVNMKRKKEILKVGFVFHNRNRKVKANDNCLILEQLVKKKNWCDIVVFASIIEKPKIDELGKKFYGTEFIGALPRKEIPKIVKKYENKTGRGIEKAFYRKKGEYLPNNSPLHPITASDNLYGFTVRTLNEIMSINLFMNKIFGADVWEVM